MGRFAYKAYTAEGAVQRGDVEASSEVEAAEILARRGLTPFLTRPVQKGISLRFIQPGKGSAPRLADFGALARQFANLLEADMPVDHALKFIAVAPVSPKLKQLVNRLLADVVSGSSLSAAIRRHADHAPPYFANIVSAGEARGHLGDAFSELASLIDSRVAIRAKFQGALTYPLILALAAVVTLSIVIIMLVPALLPLFADAGAEPPAALRLANDLSLFLSDDWPVALGVILIGLLALGIARRSEWLSSAIHKLRLRAPLWGPFEERSNVALFAHSLGTMIRAG